MRIDNKGSMDMKDVYQFTPPPSESSHVPFSNIGTFHGSDIKYKRDWNKCPKCGGLGRVFKRVEKRPGKLAHTKRLVKCECQNKKSSGKT